MNQLLPGWPEQAWLSAFPTEHRVISQGYCFTLRRPGKFLPQTAQALGVPMRQWGLLQKGQSVITAEGVIKPEQVMGPPRRGLKFVFTGDTAACDTLVVAERDADLVISEATYGDNAQGDLAKERGHMTFAQAAGMAAAAGARQLWLAHFSQSMEIPEAYLSNAQEIFKNTVCGTDGLRTTLRFTSDLPSPQP